MRHILVAVDRSEGSRRATEFVNRFFAGMDVSITAVNVARDPVEAMPAVPFGRAYPWPWPATPIDDQTYLEAAMVREEQEAEAVAVSQAPEDADVEVVFGEVVEAISLAAEDENADLIVVGTNDKGFIQRLLGGSVSQELARRSPRPVLIVR